jgi:AraC-like DNA-binding protein
MWVGVPRGIPAHIAVEAEPLRFGGGPHVDFEQVVRGAIAAMHETDAMGVEAPNPVSRLRPRPGLTIHADWVIGEAENIGFQLQCVPSDMSSLPRISAFLQAAYAEIFLHDHDYFELAYLYSGEVTHHLEDERQTLRPGDLVFLSPLVLHEMEVQPGSILMNIVIRPDLVSRSTWAALTEARVISDYLNGYQHIPGRARRRLFFPAAEQSDPQRVRTLLREFAVEATEKKPGWAVVCESMLTAVFAMLSRHVGPAEHGTGKPDEERLVQDVLVWVHENYAQATLQKVAGQFRYSPSYLSRLVSRHTGRGLSDIVRDVRLDRTVQLLENSTLPVASIATEVGFASASHLHALFRQRHGMSPGEYRRQLLS